VHEVNSSVASLGYTPLFGLAPLGIRRRMLYTDATLVIGPGHLDERGIGAVVDRRFGDRASSVLVSSHVVLDNELLELAN